MSVLQIQKAKGQKAACALLKPSKQGSHIPTSYAHRLCPSEALKVLYKESFLSLLFYFYR